MANITVGQIIVDAQRMASRIKDLEVLSGGLLMEAEGNNRHLEAMRKFQDDLDSLNRITRDKSNADMVNRINVQNPCIRKVREENRELKACLEDHERALELIMHKYREHTQSKVLTSQINFKEMYNENLWKIIREQADKITEMAAVMQRAASIDDDAMYKEIELLTKLKIENQNLREMLQISNKFDSTGKLITPNAHLLEDKAIQTENAMSISTTESDHESSSKTCANVANNNNTPNSSTSEDQIIVTQSLESSGNNNVVAIANTPPSPNAAIDNSIIANSTASTITAAVSNLEKSLKNTLNMSNSSSSSDDSRIDVQQNSETPNNPNNVITAAPTT
ncbi:FGFR1 oncogene partner 2 homolog [Eupeodes corollae]|uniref:FGFR1 oncogene partner 2 homolog n=1 Tax=Eupeodes corollae TaxID=290404 RepID=UPI002491C4E9|nr:FGFR1 oncogene partner 2 homolog [Eupeodes corollae]